MGVPTLAQTTPGSHDMGVRRLAGGAPETVRRRRPTVKAKGLGVAFTRTTKITASAVVARERPTPVTDPVFRRPARPCPPTGVTTATEMAAIPDAPLLVIAARPVRRPVGLAVVLQVKVLTPAQQGDGLGRRVVVGDNATVPFTRKERPTARTVAGRRL